MPEQLLIRLDVGLPGAVLRIALGAAVGLVVRQGSSDPSLWSAVPLLLAVLFGLKAFSAAARRAVKAPPQVQAHWDWRRDLARQHDSYQWRKMVWVGAGLLLVALPGGPAAQPLLRLGAACVAAGAAAEVVWRRKGLAMAPPR